MRIKMVSTEQANLARITHTSFGGKNPFDMIFQGLKGENTVTTRSFLYHLKNVDIIELDLEMDDIDNTIKTYQRIID